MSNSLSEFDQVIDNNSLGVVSNGGSSGNLKNPLSQSIKDFAKYKDACQRIQALESEWSKIVNDTDKGRKQRYITVDVGELRLRGDLRRDETLIPIRTIHINIEREIPSYIAFLKQSRRSAIFRNPKVPPYVLDKIETEFTRVSQYDSWERPFHKLVDCATAHGWGAVEIVYDDTKPGKFAIEYIRHEDLLFPTDTIDIQYCEFIIRRYRLSNDQLRFLVKEYDFSSEEVENLIKTNKDNRLIPVGKLMFRNTEDGLIYVCWYSLKSKEWLKEPEKLFLGVRNKVIDQNTGAVRYEDVYENEYPVEVLCYKENEDDRITRHKGRIWLDQYKQEATTAIWTGFVNRLMRASNVYASPKNPQSLDGTPKLLSMELVNGAVYDRPLDFFGLDYPNPGVINVLNMLDVQNQEETNNVAWAVNNRQDSRKTASEIVAAQQQQQVLTSVQIALFSIFLRHVYTKAWRIVKSMALQGRIIFLPDLSQEQRDIILSMEYVVMAAGDEDVVQRNERINRKMQLLNVMLQTSIGVEYLGSILKDILPDEGEKWAQLLLQSKQQAEVQGQEKGQSIQLIGALASALNGLAQSNEQSLTQDQKQNILQLLDATNTFIGRNQTAMAGKQNANANSQ